MLRVASKDEVAFRAFARIEVMFVVHRKDLTPDGRRPVRLSGYGGFNILWVPEIRCGGAV
jgi:hypothetical protein